ncbi:MAG TPA: flagellar filament capping protein FliD [Methylomusa anaerophila]|uniref:Flagellar hook-associated protein 2 n=1 Tax=Methylomusa anaerophila TaxID=1930071 RepID=A0A348AH54_9FIRM|nr:flagellar filament capping protein FliD [Methylomusa anaerophila]BBB90402.1 flagellar capping protein [Methylomusa anaerophila]HML90383.1 flagellar filament capping protein FliD [Methylomusa anaerophila]
MSSSSSVTSTTVNGTTRITGLSSGLDVDSIVEQLMTAQKSKLYQLQKQEQLAEWKQDAYRSIIEDIQTFSSTYFDITSSNSLLKSSNFNKYAVSSSSSAVTATYTGTASAGSHTIAVEQLATAATLTSSLAMEVAGGTDVSAGATISAGASFVIELDGTERTVTFDSDETYSSGTDLATAVQTAIDEAVGSGKVTASVDSTTGYLTITAAADSGIQEITLSAPASGTSALSALGFTSDGASLSNRLDTSDTLLEIASQLGIEDSLFNSDGQIELTINGTTLSFDQDDSLSNMIKKINSSSSGATMTYDEISGQLTLTADDTGTGSTLVVTEPTDATYGSSNFLSLVFNSASVVAGTDAVAWLDGTKLTRSSNTFTVNGVKYTLNATTTDTTTETASSITADEKVTVSLSQDVDSVYDLISSFVDDYNSLISTINSKLDEDYNYDYPPLTDDEKDSMTDEEITKWETKAKTGLLANDSLLKSFLTEMRSSLIESVSGLSTNIFGIGISTGTYDENGKLYIDEDTLKEAITSDPAAVMNLFTQESSSYPGTTTRITYSSSELRTRYKEEGLAYRFYDVIQKYIATVGDDGLLIQKAGIEDTAADTDNALSDQISDLQDKISAEEDRLDAKEDSLYEQYTNLETYINKMNSQLSALQSMLGVSSS